jgi:hypothetical protein
MFVDEIFDWRRRQWRWRHLGRVRLVLKGRAMICFFQDWNDLEKIFFKKKIDPMHNKSCFSSIILIDSVDDHWNKRRMDAGRNSTGCFYAGFCSIASVLRLRKPTIHIYITYTV